MTARGVDFAQLEWRADSVALNGLVFRLQHALPPGNDDLSSDFFRFYKAQSMVDDYAIFFAEHPSFDARRMVELGIWDGGSLVLWNELLRPDVLIGVDLSTRGDNPYFNEYVATRSLAGHVFTHWGVDQSDRATLLRLLHDHDCATLDLVIDDASHLYGPTRASFETLFPLVRPGGYYIIEDWGWSHFSDFSGPESPWRYERPLADLIADLLAVMASTPGVIARVAVFRDFAAFERGGLDLEPGLDLEALILRRWQPSRGHLAYRATRRRLAPGRRRLRHLMRR